MLPLFKRRVKPLDLRVNLNKNLFFEFGSNFSGYLEVRMCQLATGRSEFDSLLGNP
jgi:hypothetical protein